jgi:hypothetical protein
MPGKIFGSRKIYLSIVQGTLRQTVDKTTENAVERKYKTKDKAGNEIEATKWELSFIEWYGRVLDIRLKNGEYGEVLEIEFEDAIITMHIKSRFFINFMQKLPNINLNKTFSVHPYDFEANGKKLKGVSIEQEGEKIKSYYWNDKDGVPAHGIPVAPFNAKKTYLTDDWELFFGTMRKFLKETLPKYVANINLNIPEESKQIPDEIHTETNDGSIREDEVISGKIFDEDDKEEVKLADVPF